MPHLSDGRFATGNKAGEPLCRASQQDGAYLLPSQVGQVRVGVLAALVRLLVGLAVDIVEALAVPDEVHRLQAPIRCGFNLLLCELI